MSTKKKTSLTEAARDAITGYTVIVLSIVCFILVLMLVVAAARILSGFNTTSQATTKPSTTTTTTTSVKNYHAGAYIVADTNQSVASYDANTTDTGATSAHADLANTAVYRVYSLPNTNGAA